MWAKFRHQYPAFSERSMRTQVVSPEGIIDLLIGKPEGVSPGCMAALLVVEKPL
jgi:hypothetical protein